MRAEPAPLVVGWVETQAAKELHTTSITVAEIHYRIRRLPAGRRRDKLANAVGDVFGGFAWQILPFDHRAALRYGELVAELERRGRAISAFDAQIAAICLCTDSTLVTRNVDDFADAGIELINPWQGL
jgi:predicted nucleic acid-binding protein